MTLKKSSCRVEGFIILINYMKMRRVVIIVKHPNDNSIEATYFWHYVTAFLLLVQFNTFSLWQVTINAAVARLVSICHSFICHRYLELLTCKYPFYQGEG